MQSMGNCVRPSSCRRTQKKPAVVFTTAGFVEIMPAATYSPTRPASAARRLIETEPHAEHGKLCAPFELPAYTKKARCRFHNSGLRRDNAGSDLLSHTVSHAVPSAVSGLTSVFGMGTGVTLI